MEFKKGYTFDDILLVPQYAEVDTREGSVATKAKLFDFDLDVPVLSSPMDTITEISMMEALRECGAMGVHHRYVSENILYTIAKSGLGGIAISPSISVEKINTFHGANPKTFFCLDVAHGNTKKNLDYCKELITNGIYNIISGNLVTADAVERYLKIGINHFRVGIGPGSVCSTRQVCGVGYPQGSAIFELHKEFGDSIKIIGDGGLNNSGDVCKALSLGAQYVMTGKLLSGTSECPIKGVYRGMASKESLSTRKSDFFVEGESIHVEDKGKVSNVINQIKEAIQMSCYYCGCEHYSELINIPKVLITSSSKREGEVRKQ
jgi:IMP dehydrogenase